MSYKQSLVLVLETGKVVFWTGYADDPAHAEGRAIDEAKEKYGCQIYDMAVRPVEDGKVLKGVDDHRA